MTHDGHKTIDNGYAFGRFDLDYICYSDHLFI